MIRKKTDPEEKPESIKEEEKLPASSVKKGPYPRIQTAEGWKRSQLRKRQQKTNS